MRIVETDPQIVDIVYEKYYDKRLITTVDGFREWQTKYFSRSDITKCSFVDGWRAPTPYIVNETIQRPFRYKSTWTDKSGHQTVSEKGVFLFGNDWSRGQYMPIPDLLKSESTVQSALVYSALAKVKDTKINLAVTLAEIGETIGMIAETFTKLRKAYGLAKTGRWKQAYDTLGVSMHYRKGIRDLSSGWLELQFGWKPLLADIHGAIDEINRRTLTRGYTIVGRAQTSETTSVLRAKDAVFMGPRVGITTLWKLKKTQKVSLWYRVDTPGLRRAAALGLLNPALIIWERTWLSFMIDWVTTVGDWLESLDATLGLTYKGGTHTYLGTQEVVNQSASSEGDSNWKNTSLGFEPGAYKRMSMVRSVITDIPTNRFFFKNPFSTSHAITATALLITSLKTR